MPTTNKHVVVIGAGIVGCAVFLELLKRGYRVSMLEKEKSLANHQTSRNSGVIHAGPYYAPESHKATMCGIGRKLLIDYHMEKGLPLRVTGKLLLATNEVEVSMLQGLLSRSRINGVRAEIIPPERVIELEPNAFPGQALHVEDTAVTDFRLVAESLVADGVSLGGDVHFGAKVSAINEVRNGWEIEYSGGSLVADFFVNAAGLASDRVARLARVDQELSIVPFKGEYLSLVGQSKSLVNGLIYPVPNPKLPFLGLHLTRMLSGELHAGPNATLALGREAYGRWGLEVKELLGIVKTPGLSSFAWKNRKFLVGEVYRSLSLNATAKALQLLVPKLDKNDLTRVEAGIRAQALSADGQLVDDFVIKSLTRQVHILNAPSPAATSSLAIALKISKLVQEQLN